MRRAALALALAVSLACGTEPQRPPNVVLIVADTLRADHLSTYGYGVPTSPELDDFAATATLYRSARSTAPWTLPSHASLFTGLLPFQHGAHTVDAPPGRSNARALAPSAVTLAEVLVDAGYRTGGIVTNRAFLLEKYGLSQGFDRWTVKGGIARRHEPRILEFVDAEDDRPFFLFLNFMDTHRPYNSIERPGLLPRPVGQRSVELLNALYESVLTGSEPPDSSRIQALIDEYDTSIAHLDEALGRLFDALDERDLFDDAIVVVTSDHGEYFGEQDLIEHSKDVYEPALAIPLIVKAPGQRAPAVVDERISLAHVPGLILDQLPAPLRASIAADAPALAHGPTERDRRIVAAENHYSRSKDLTHPRFGARFDRVRHVLYDGDLKLIRSSDGQHELYDLDADASERTNLYATSADAPALDAHLTAMLTGWLRIGVGGSAVEETGADLERLEALGYH